ncbi:MAG: hypothetical protein CVU05_07180 [Bacteroidetes bacterium HGW-Bacteroidetes-21]|jgi:nucleoid DNA-binding protein/type III secretory pathway component EscR|nr:MAG: hypothetical protein CVU05_07180 [Bacteroidetes bacterium HGW-Bacteroidetes-21]
MNKAVSDISSYCFQLLLMHDCVIIPGFGAFIAQNRPAYFSDQYEKFFPPSRQISFNRSIVANDGLLIHHVSVIESLSYSDARSLVKQMTEQLEVQLNVNKVIELNGIGSFYLQKGQPLFFKPVRDGIMPVFAYGLVPVALSPLKSAESLRQVKELMSRTPGAFQTMAGVALLLALTLLPVKISRQSLVHQQKATFEIPVHHELYSDDNKDSLSQVIDEMTDKKNALLFVETTEKKLDKASKDTVVVESKKIETVPVTETAKKQLDEQNAAGFYLIAGSFVEMWRVESFVKEITQKGFSTSIVKSDGKLRVSVAYSAIREEAEKHLADYRRAHPEMAFWLLAKK